MDMQAHKSLGNWQHNGKKKSTKTKPKIKARKHTALVTKDWATWNNHTHYRGLVCSGKFCILCSTSYTLHVDLGKYKFSNKP